MGGFIVSGEVFSRFVVLFLFFLLFFREKGLGVKRRREYITAWRGRGQEGGIHRE